MKKCPYCAEEIQDEAIKCKHCGSEIATTRKIIKKTENKICPECSKVYDITWGTCPQCNVLLEKHEAEIEVSEEFVPEGHGDIAKIKESGCAPAVISLIIPGSGQMVKGQIGKGIVFLVLAIGLGVISYGILAIVIAIISCIDAASPSYKCPKCKSGVEKDASVCKFCKTKLKIS